MLLAGAAHDLSDQERQQAAIQKGFTELQVLHRQLKDLNAQLEQKVDERTHTLTEAYRKLEEQNKALQELDQLKSDFVSMVSHELRTPLTSLNGGLELLLLQKSRPAPDRSTLALMKDEVGRLTKFVENILNISATEAGKIRLNLRPISLYEVIQTVCQNFSTTCGAGQIQVQVSQDLPSVMADDVFLIGIFTHLLDNALKYAPASPVMVEAIQKETRCASKSRTRGLGFPKLCGLCFLSVSNAWMPKIHSRFMDTAWDCILSRRMLRAMQSDLRFEAPLEGGARFYFNLKVSE